MYRRLLIFSCKVLIKLLRLVGKNGSALPGLIIERLYPEFLSKSLASVEERIVLVTGTNGKTTTTKMLVAGLRGAGLKVVTNATGSNMTRGLIAALIEDMTYTGSLKPTDWFVFEMDEAYAPLFTQNLSPKLVVALNVLRDQLDRYGEIDKTAQLIKQAGSKAEIFVFNALDPLLSNVASELEGSVTVSSFGISNSLLDKVRNEQTLHGQSVSSGNRAVDTRLEDYKELGDDQDVHIKSDGNDLNVALPLVGFHNALNCTASVAVLLKLTPSKVGAAVEGIALMPVPFGRGEKLHMRGKSITVALVKNPSGFASNLETFVKHAKPDLVVFVVNDKLADGRDVSWLWDVTFTGNVANTTKVYTSGIRGYDMALRLKYDDLKTNTILSVPKMMQYIMKSKYSNVVIIPTYTALFEVREALSRYGKVPRIW